MVNVPAEYEADGETVVVQGGFMDHWPRASLGGGAPLGHAPGSVQFSLVGGWGGGNRQVGSDRFQLWPSEFGFGWRSRGIMVMATHPGDERYAATEMLGFISFPEKLTNGAPQVLDFPELSVPVMGRIALRATSSAGLPVHYTVLAGPAVVEGDGATATLVLTDLPRCTRAAGLPLKIRVAAWQCGRAVSPWIQTAVPVVREWVGTP